MNATCVRHDFLLAAFLIAGSFVDINAEDTLKPISLPPARMTGGKPVMQTLKERQSLREFSPASIPRQVLSDLLWAAYGINRPENGHRTAPSAMNSQEIDIYVVLAEGTFLYDARTRCLQPVKIGDLRRKTGGQEFVTVAPLALVYIADLDKLQKAKPEVKERYAAIDTGSIIQNVYLYCASEDLATVVHELDAQAFHESLKLKPSQKIVIAQSVGYAKSPPKSPPPPK